MAIVGANGIFVVGGGPVGLPGRDGTNGTNGTNGRDGAPGPGMVEARFSSFTIAINTNVIDLGNGQCRLADPTNPAHCGKLLGLVIAGGTPGSQLLVQTGGHIAGVTGSFNAGDTLYLAPDGGLTNVMPVTEGWWLQTLGTAISSTEISYLKGTPGLIVDSLVDPSGGYLGPSILTGQIPTSAGFVRKGQFLRALETGASPAGAGSIQKLEDALRDDPGNVNNIAWVSTPFVTQGSTLAQFAKTTLGLTDLQLAAVFAAAAVITDF